MDPYRDMTGVVTDEQINLLAADLRKKAEVEALVRAHGQVLVDETATRIVALVHDLRNIDLNQPQAQIDQELRKIHMEILCAYSGIDLISGIIRVGQSSEQQIDAMQEMENVSD